ncbi:MAG: site-2 protease family protein, partial [Cyanobacteria bacterium P01_C01_bin.89]
MTLASENFVTLAIAAIAVGILGWGFARSRPFGKVGLLAWLQSVSLMLPWLTFFTLFALGIYVNLVGVLVLLGVSTGIYIYLGKRLRTIAKDLPPSAVPKWRSQPLSAEAASSDATDPNDPGKPMPQGMPVTPGLAPMPQEDIDLIKGIFGIDTFFATETLPYQEGVIFKGNLRGEPAETHAVLSTKLKDLVGDRYVPFLVEGP